MVLPEKFLHICEVCGETQVISSKEAFDAGWDYPGPDGLYATRPQYGFGSLAPRTCPNCPTAETLWFRLLCNQGSTEDLTAKDNELLHRIKNEPQSLIPTLAPKGSGTKKPTNGKD